MRKKEEILVPLEIFWFEHSGRVIVPPPPKLLCSPTTMLEAIVYGTTRNGLCNCFALKPILNTTD